ncbi:MAG: S1 RNA-binding domain-containing protein, partial [Trichodesmium sp. St19_bin2]|nr:S1 RNA-binding domain-containing protein [Trichodesmium sp. St19_bin2]
DEERNRLVLSHRRALVERKMNRLEVGEVVIGAVRGIKPYGAFIDIGGVSGLLHISEISHDHIETPSSVLKVNDELKVMIIDLDADRGRISLSTKQLEPEPGAMVKNPQMVYDQAEEMAAKFREKMMAPQGGETAVETPEVGAIAEATEAPEGVVTAEALEAPEEVATSEALKVPEEVTSEALKVPEELATAASQKTEETTVEIAIVDEETSAAALE